MRRALHRVGLALVLTLGAPIVSTAAAAGEEGDHGAAHELSCGAIWGETSFIAMVVNFGLLVAVLMFLGRKPLMRFLSERRRGVEEGLEEAARMKEEADAKYREYTERLETLDKELGELRKEMIAAGEAERDRIVAEAEKKAARMRREAKFAIEQQMKQLREDLTREAVEAAIAAAEQVLRDKSTEADQERLAKQYLEALDKVAQNGSKPASKSPTAASGSQQERVS